MSAHPIPSWPTLRPMGHLRAYIADPIGLFTEAHQRFGPVVKIWFLSEPVLSVSTPDAAHRILVDNARNYVKDTPGYTVLRRLLGLGLVTAEGADWRRKRRIANPAFHRRCLAGFVETMNTATADWSATLHARADTEAPVEMSGELVKLTLRIAGETLFHVDLTEESDGVSRAVRTALECFNDQLMTALPPLSWLPLPGARRIDEAIADLDRVVQGIIDGRRTNPEEKADLLGMLMGVGGRGDRHSLVRQRAAGRGGHDVAHGPRDHRQRPVLGHVVARRGAGGRGEGRRRGAWGLSSGPHRLC